MQYGTLKHVSREELTELEYAKRLYTRLFTQRKRDERPKGRTVADTGSRAQDRTDLIKGQNSGSYSPTVSTPAVFMTCAIAAHIRGSMTLAQRADHRFRQCDIKAAYLNAEMTLETDAKTERQFRRVVEMRGAEAETMVEMNKKHKWWGDGVTELYQGKSLFFVLKKTLYGLLQAAVHWYETMSRLLVSECEMTQSEEDLCIFYWKPTDKVEAIICLYIDDLLIFSDQRVLDGIRCKMDEKFRSDFGESNNTYCQKTTLDYLNLSLTNQDDGSITIDQESYITLIEA